MALTISPRELVAVAEASERPGLLSCHPSWERVQLGAIADVLNGFAFKSHSFNHAGDGLPLIRIRDVSRGATETYYSGAYESQYLVKSGDIIVGMDGDFRVATWRGPAALLNQRVCKLTIRDKGYYDPRFLVLVLQGYLDAIEAATSSVTVKHLSSRSVQEIPLPLPPLAEQHRIVEELEDHLSRLDAATHSLVTTELRLSSLRASLLMSAQRVNKTADGWTSSTIGELAAVGTGATPLKSRSDYYVGGTVPWVTSSLLNAPLITKSDKYITGLAVQETSANVYPAGTILVAMYGEGKTRGKSAELGFPAAINQACAAIVLHPEYEFRRPWIKLALEAQYERLRRLSSGGVQPNLNLGLIKRIEIPLPPPAEQDALLAQVDAWSTGTHRLRAATKSLQARSAHLRKSVMERAFMGKLVPQDPADETASALLDRIHAAREAQGGKPKRAVRRPRKAVTADAPPPPPVSSTPSSIGAVQQELPL
ncbi:restriction endonuclease subunit S [Streptomyces sp. NPDC005953]|uniref:restriction endonuclease subunit S n=1 Tax=Streptomyces sp. NPDC005953 TaxID=3156719 RepID=UPI0033E35A66